MIKLIQNTFEDLFDWMSTDGNRYIIQKDKYHGTYLAFVIRSTESPNRTYDITGRCTVCLETALEMILMLIKEDKRLEQEEIDRIAE